MRYPTLYERLVANTAEPAAEQACWHWTAKRDRWGYGRLNVYVPGVGGNVTLMAHIAMWVALECGPLSVDDFYLAYLELTTSGLELDHSCVEPCCIHPDHLSLVTGSENCLLRDARRR